MSLVPNVRFTPTAGGTANFTYSSALTGWQSPASGGAVNGATYRYYAGTLDLSQWEIGQGTWNSSTGVLSRTTVLYNSLGTGTGAGQSGAGTLINFSTVPAVSLIMFTDDIIPSGTLMLFQQTSAPTGWTKQTTYNDAALRIVSGTAGSGGSNAFSTVMAQTVVGNTTISTATMPSHSHGVIDPGHVHTFGVNSEATGGSAAFATCTSSAGNQSAPMNAAVTNISIQANGSGGAHNHSITMAMKYVDSIIATKN